MIFSANDRMSVAAVTLSAMKGELPPTLRYLAGNQSGVISRAQALRTGLTVDMIKFRLRSDRWRPIHPGVYATFTGAPSRRARLWAAVLSAGTGAVLSYQTAAELQGLTDKPDNSIHVTVPRQRHVAAIEGISLHRSGRAVEATEIRSYPPRTRVEETVLDLTQTAKTFDDVCGWVTRAIARELTVAATGGDHSVLEFRYHRDVERAHGLPESVRQVAFTTRDGRRGRRDRVYSEYGVVIELDGRLAHPAENRRQDKSRDNAAAAAGEQTLRYGWDQVKWEPCATAAEVARVRRLHGWDGRPRPCSPGCPVGAE